MQRLSTRNNKGRTNIGSRICQSTNSVLDEFAIVPVAIGGAGLHAHDSNEWGGLTTPVFSTYTVLSTDTISTIATGLAALINSNTTLQAIGVTAQAAANGVNVKYNPTNYPSASAASVSGATESISMAMNSNVNQQAVIGGTKTTGDVLTIGVNDSGLTGGSASVTYTVASSDTLAAITSGLAAAVNASTSLQAIGVSASASSTILTLNSNSPNVTTYVMERILLQPKQYFSDSIPMELRRLQLEAPKQPEMF
jgi:hypothetical protein